MSTKQNKEAFWLASMIFIAGASLIVAGVWLKSGPETAMIVLGVILAWFASYGLKYE